MIEVDSKDPGLIPMKHSFSIEINSKKSVKNLSISDEDHNKVFFEGFLGELKSLVLLEGRLLEIKGSNGILRLDISEEELKSMKKISG